MICCLVQLHLILKIFLKYNYNTKNFCNEWAEVYIRINKFKRSMSNINGV